MTNNQRFLQAFNNIEKNLRAVIDASNSMPFYKLIDINSRKNKLIKHYEKELETMGDLRNFIVHGDIKEPLAIASEKTVKRIEFIEKQIINPMKISEVFHKHVVGLKEDDSLAHILNIIKDNKYSQYPVINKDGFIGLITENGITNWLANNIEENIISIKDTKIKDILLKEEEKESYNILYSRDSLYDVIEEFNEDRNSANRKFIIIVLEKPKEKFFLEDIYTILTPWDLDKIYENLGFKV